MSYVRTLFLSTLLGFAACGAAYAETIAIIGTGQVANALGPMFAEQGHTIIYGSRNPARDTVRELIARTGAGASAAQPAEAVARAEVVMVAVPWDALPDVVRSLGDLTGKIVIDPTNPRIVGDDGLRDWAHDTSNAEILQELAPGARVVKALNTMNWRTMVDPMATGGPVSVPVVGDDEQAKAFVVELIDAIGLEPIDLGPLRYARMVEGMYILWGNANTLERGFNYYLRPAP
ncbi:MAG: NADPH-dependent F420 reductase [Gammaproteobacteria bacterium]|nr:NADPH-dependent F420 reductase [Gammaproteobacteria bacterium]MDH3508245.1 NADPH-dependent F420 reductase [Gammaproteobacteria bacterium]